MDKDKLRMKLPAKVENKVTSSLNNKEKILYSFKGMWGTNKKQYGSPWLILTKERIFIIGKGILTLDIREIPYEHIKSLDYKQSPIADTLTIFAHSNAEKIQFFAIDRKYSKQFLSIIKDLMGKNKPSSNNDEEDSLQILKLRYAKGEITKEEFEEIKKEL